MGTRADFYIGRGKAAKWIGSCAYDGHEDTMKHLGIVGAESRKDFVAAVEKRIAKEDGTRPDDGWPWPWDDGHLTDRSYAWDNGKVWLSAWGRKWLTWEQYLAREAEAKRLWDEEEREIAELPKVPFPNMKKRRNMAPVGSRKSGTLLVYYKEKARRGTPDASKPEGA